MSQDYPPITPVETLAVEIERRWPWQFKANMRGLEPQCAWSRGTVYLDMLPGDQVRIRFWRDVNRRRLILDGVETDATPEAVRAVLLAAPEGMIRGPYPVRQIREDGQRRWWANDTRGVWTCLDDDGCRPLADHDVETWTVISSPMDPAAHPPQRNPWTPPEGEEPAWNEIPPEPVDDDSDPALEKAAAHLFHGIQTGLGMRTPRTWDQTDAQTRDGIRHLVRSTVAILNEPS